MGYNTTVVVLNDALSFIEDDAEFGKRLVQAILEAGTSGRKKVTVAARSSRGGIHCNAATVIESHHADHTVFVKVGGNFGEVVTMIDKSPFKKGERAYYSKLMKAERIAGQEKKENPDV